MKDISIVVPVYNGAMSIEQLFLRIKATMEAHRLVYEVIFVEDCGADNSWEVLLMLQKLHPSSIIAIKLAKNFGQHNATLCGLKYSKGDVVVTIDDDLQIPPEEILSLLRYQKTNDLDLVYGVYTEGKRHSIFRNLGSNLIQKVVQKAFDTNGEVTSFRLMTRQLVDSISKNSQSAVFLEGLLHWNTSNIGRVAVRHDKRSMGTSNYNISKLIKLSSHLLFNFTTIPLKLSVYLGGIFSCTSFSVGIIFIIRKLIWDVPIGFTAIIVSIFFTGGIILLILGIMGEYLSRLYMGQHEKPQFSVRKIKQN